MEAAPEIGKTVVDMDELDLNFGREILKEPGGEQISKCFQCGVCAASCPVSAVDKRFNPRRIIHIALLGMRKQVLTSDFVWLCSQCYMCHERCPQDVRIPDLMLALRNIAVRAGYVHPAYKELASALKSHSRVYEIEDFVNLKRKKMGLPPLTIGLLDVKTIIEKTGLDADLQKSEAASQ